MAKLTKVNCLCFAVAFLVVYGIAFLLTMVVDDDDTTKTSVNVSVPSSHKGLESTHEICACRNGGRCHHGKCQCKRNYRGRHCQHHAADRSCGHTPHGTWGRFGCNVCRCHNGVISCTPRFIPGCGGYKSVDSGQQTRRPSSRARGQMLLVLRGTAHPEVTPTVLRATDD
ncbi:hypothetical protein ScPMuIL_000866 [Solemya velum]